MGNPPPYFLFAENRQRLEHSRSNHHAGDGHAQDMVDIAKLDLALIAKGPSTCFQRGVVPVAICWGAGF